MANGKKILIVEDEKFLSLILRGRFEREGFLVLQAGDGDEGLKMAQEKPDIILLDLIMPKVSGFEFLERFRVDPALSTIPVVVASNLGQDSDIQKAKDLGVADYYVKATTPVEDIARMVKRTLGMPEDVQMEVPEGTVQESVAEGTQPETLPQEEPILQEQVLQGEQPEPIQPEAMSEPTQEQPPVDINNIIPQEEGQEPQQPQQ